LSDLRSFRFPLPPYDEQKLIAETLTQVFASALSIADECSAIAKQADLLDQAILTKAFRGELVPYDPNDEPASALLARIREQRMQQIEAAKHKQKTAITQWRNQRSEESSRPTPQQLTLTEVLLTKD
jgi:type I restriction enzyme S subunit